MNAKLLSEKKIAADKNWKTIFDRMNAGEKIDMHTIVNALDRCNKADEALLHYEKSFVNFMKEREKYLIDCDKSSGYAEIDSHYQKLREQYQLIFGNDVKHG